MENQHQSSPSAASLLAIFGGVLVVVSITALVSANWGSLNAWLKIATVTAPMLLLYLAAYGTRKQEQHKEVTTIALVTANLIFPFALGVTYSQLAGQPPLDASFLALIAGVTAIYYILLEFAGRMRAMSVLTLLAVSVHIIALGALFNNESTWLFDVFSLLVGILALCAASFRSTNSTQRTAFHIYLAYGTLLASWAALALPFSLTNSADLGEWPNQLAQIGIAALAVIGAISAARWERAASEAGFRELRRWCEALVGLFAVILPVITVLNTSPEASNAFIVLITALMSTLGLFLLSMKIPQQLWRTVSSIGLAALFIDMMMVIFRNISLSWPISLLILGSLLFALAFFLNSASKDRLVRLGRWFSAESDGRLWGLGDVSAAAKKSGRVTQSLVEEVVRPDGSVVRFMTDAPVNTKGSETSLFAYTALVACTYIILYLFLHSLPFLSMPLID